MFYNSRMKTINLKPIMIYFLCKGLLCVLTAHFVHYSLSVWFNKGFKYQQFPGNSHLKILNKT